MTLTGGNCISLNEYKNGCLAASASFSLYLHNQLSSINVIIMYQEYSCLKNVIHQIVSKTEWLLFSARVIAKFRLVFVLTLENAFY